MKGTTGKRIRRKSAYTLLEEQLKRGTKPEKVNKKTTTKMIPLSEADKRRISTEMEKLSKKSF